MSAVVVEAVRTSVGRRNDDLSSIHPADSSAVVLNARVERAGINPVRVVGGCVQRVGEQVVDVARTALLTAGWPESVPGVTLDRQRGSSQQAVYFASRVERPNTTIRRRR